jgi:type I restriction enzyme S subunit
MLGNVKKGYKKTEIGTIPSDWEVIQIAQLFNFKNGLNKEKQFFGRGIPILNYMDVYNNCGISNKKQIKGLVDLSGKEINNYNVKKGDVFFTRTSETIDEIGLSSVILFDPDKTVFSGFVLRARPKSNKMDMQYCKYIFREWRIRKQITKKSSYTTRALTNSKLLGEVRIPIPKLEEQCAIGEVLSDFDNLIESLTKLISKKRLIKQGTMSELLSGDKRLRHFHDEWSSKKLHELGEFCSSKRVFLEDYVASGIPFYRGKEIKELNQGLSVKDMLYITKEKYMKIRKKYGVPKVGDILISAVGSLGNIYLVTDDNPFYFKDGNLIWLKNISISSLFLKYMLEFKNDKLLKTAIGSSQKALTIISLKDVEIRMPKELKEQQAIAKVLFDIDKEIEQLEKQLEKYKFIKESMMNKLLTGKVRLV